MEKRSVYGNANRKTGGAARERARGGTRGGTPHSLRFVGNIYRGKIVSILPGIQAAFVDIGLEKAAFPHASEWTRRCSSKRRIPLRNGAWTGRASAGSDPGSHRESARRGPGNRRPGDREAHRNKGRKGDHADKPGGRPLRQRAARLPAIAIDALAMRGTSTLWK